AFRNRAGIAPGAPPESPAPVRRPGPKPVAPESVYRDRGSGSCLRLQERVRDGGQSWIAGSRLTQDYTRRGADLTEKTPPSRWGSVEQVLQLRAQPGQDPRFGDVDGADAHAQFRGNFRPWPVVHLALPERLPGLRLEVRPDQLQGPADQVLPILRLLQEVSG